MVGLYTSISAVLVRRAGPPNYISLRGRRAHKGRSADNAGTQQGTLAKALFSLTTVTTGLAVDDAERLKSQYPRGVFAVERCAVN